MAVATGQFMKPLVLIAPVLGREVQLSLEPGFTTLYGLNGAGKSLVLEALTSCLTGVVGTRFAPATPRERGPRLLASLPRVTRPHATPAWPALDLADELAHAVGRIFGSDVGDFFESELVDSVSEALLRHLVSLDGPDGYQEVATELAWTVGSQLTFIVTPAGTASSPAWEITPSWIGTWAESGLAEHVAAGAPASAGTWIVGGEVGDWHPVEATGLEDQMIFEPEPLWYAESPSRLFSPMIGDDEEDLDEATANHVAEVLARTAPAEGSETSIHSVLADAARTKRPSWAKDEAVPYTPNERTLRRHLELDDLQMRADAIYESLLMEPPTLHLEMRPVKDWINRPALRWTARRSVDDSPVPLSQLSTAERRWARIAIKMTLLGKTGGYLVLDEPEAALHRTAEGHMANGLSRLEGLKVVVATHSPELLDERRARRVWVRRRGPGQTSDLVPFRGAEQAEMTTLGLMPSDLLRQDRAYVLVEGEHDYQILLGYFGPRLRDAGVRLLPLRGASRLKTALDSQFLLTYSDAKIFAFLDGLNVPVIDTAWQEALTAVAANAPISEVIDRLRVGLAGIDKKTREFLEPFLTGALQHGHHTRVEALGIAGSDILDYLPVEELVPGAESWHWLRERLARGMDKAPTETQFKEWLVKVHRADLSPEHLRSAAERSAPGTELSTVVERILDDARAHRHR